MVINELKNRGEELIRDYKIVDLFDGKLIQNFGEKYQYHLYLPRDKSKVYRVTEFGMKEVGYINPNGYHMTDQYGSRIHCATHILKWLVFNLDKVYSLTGGFNIHHKNRDRSDFTLDNLECVECHVHWAIHSIEKLKKKEIYRDIIEEIVVIDGWFNRGSGSIEEIVHLYGLMKGLLFKYNVVKDREHYYRLRDLLRIWEELGGLIDIKLLERYIDIL